MSAPFCVANVFLEILVVGPIGVVQQPVLEPTGPLRIDNDLFVHAALAITALVPAEQPKHLIRVPAAVFDFVPHKEIASPHPVTVEVARWALQDLTDLVGKLWSDPFVGVDHQYPGVARLRNRPILEVSVVDELSLNQAAATHFAHNVHGFICRAGIRDEYFVGDSGALPQRKAECSSARLCRESRP